MVWDVSVWLIRPQQGQRVAVLHSDLVSPLFRSSRLHRGESVETQCPTISICAKAYAIDIFGLPVLLCQEIWNLEQHLSAVHSIRTTWCNSPRRSANLELHPFSGNIDKAQGKLTAAESAALKRGAHTEREDQEGQGTALTLALDLAAGAHLNGLESLPIFGLAVVSRHYDRRRSRH